MLYRGSRSAGRPIVTRTDADGTNRVLVSRPGLALSCDSFDWGVDSIEAEQLAFTILSDAFGDEEAFALYIDFKFDVIADLEDDWVLHSEDLADWLGGYSEP